MASGMVFPLGLRVRASGLRWAQESSDGTGAHDAQKAADAKFIASIDDYYKGDRKKGAEDVSRRGWQFLRQGNAPEAMKRFNQAWLLDNANGNALCGRALRVMVSIKTFPS